MMKKRISSNLRNILFYLALSLFVLACTQNKNSSIDQNYTGENVTNLPPYNVTNPKDNKYYIGLNAPLYTSISGSCDSLRAGSLSFKVNSIEREIGSCINNSFRFDVQSNSLAEGSNPITITSPQAGTLSLDYIKDSISPTFSIAPPRNVISNNVNSYSISGNCSEDGILNYNISGIQGSTACSNLSWTAQNISLVSLADSLSLEASFEFQDLAGNPAINQSMFLLKDTSLPTITVSSPSQINASNVLGYSISGTCSESNNLSISIGSIVQSAECSGNLYTLPPVDTSSQSDGTIAISISQVDSFGNEAIIETAVLKDTALPTVTINALDTIDQFNQNSYQLGGTCSEENRLVSIDIAGIATNSTCSGGVFQTSFIDVSSLPNGTVSITADHDNEFAVNAIQAFASTSKDTNTISVEIASAENITLNNQTNYLISGTCSENTISVNLDIGGILKTVTCAAETWTSGFIDVSTLPDGNIGIAANHSTAPTDNISVQKITSAPSIISLSTSSVLSTQAELVWSISGESGHTLNDFEISYRNAGTTNWTTYNDGVSTNKFSMLSGLTPRFSYEIRVRALYDGVNFTEWSSILEIVTLPDNQLFGENKAMNVGGATTSTVAAFEDNTDILLNDNALVTLNKGETHTFTSAIYDVIDSNKPIYTAGRKGSGSDPAKGNMAWIPTAWAGKYFSFNSTRSNPQVVEVYAIEASTIEIVQGSTVLDSTILAVGQGDSLSWSVYGSFQLVSSGLILAYHYAAQSNRVVDPKPLMPASNEIIGFPSNSMRLTTNFDATNYTVIHSDSTTLSGSLNKEQVVTINPSGYASLYSGNSLLINADKEITGASFADSNGFCAAAFLPTSYMKLKHIINVASSYVAFASKEAGTIQVLDPNDNLIETLTLNNSGNNINAPYKARRAATPAGYRFISSVPVAAWYQASSDTGGAANDETILYGTNE
jgi:hypothetical protein